MFLIIIWGLLHQNHRDSCSPCRFLGPIQICWPVGPGPGVCMLILTARHPRAHDPISLQICLGYRHRQIMAFFCNRRDAGYPWAHLELIVKTGAHRGQDKEGA